MLHMLPRLLLAALLVAPPVSPRGHGRGSAHGGHTWLGDHETCPMWYAKEHGWDKKAGLNVEMKRFASGADMLTALASRGWHFALMGAVPAMPGNDASDSNGVLLLAGSEARVSGWNRQYPQVCGSPQTERGKTFLVTTFSSAHHALKVWLELLGLRDRDIIRNMEQKEALAAFERGEGDGAALWAPYRFDALHRGAVLAANMRLCGHGNPVAMVADTRYAARHPDVTARFLGVHLWGIAAIRSTPPEQLVPQYQRFYQQFSHREYSVTLALHDLRNHPVYTLQEQLALFDDSHGPRQVQQWQAGGAKFFSALEHITSQEARKEGDGTYATGTYPRLLACQQLAPSGNEAHGQ